MSNKFRKNYRINIFDVDSNHQCTISALMNYLWDVVVSQSDYLGETEEGFIHNQCVWVLLKYDIKIYDYPKFKDIITVDTEATGIRKFYGYRHNTVRNSEGAIICDVISTAILIDLDKRRPMKISDEQCKIYGLKEELDKIPPLDDIPKLNKIDYSKKYPIRYSDIDCNGHVNNAKYMDMAIDSLPRSILNEYNISNIKILFKKETTDGDILNIESEVLNSEDNSITTIHTITSSNDKLLTKLQFNWKKKIELSQ